MARFVATVRTERERDDVFSFVADLENFVQWDPGVESSTQRTGRGPGLGASYDISATGADLTYTVIKFDPPNCVVAEAKTKLLYSYDVITVEERQESTYVTYDATLNLNGPLALGDAAFALMFKKIGESAIDGLVDALHGIRVS